MDERSNLIAAILQEVAEIARDLTAARSKPFGTYRLSKNQLNALFILAHTPTPVTAGTLADALGVTPGAVTQVVGRLRELDLVDIVTPEEDARVRVIRLTPPSQSHVDAFERDAVARLTPQFSGIDAEQLQQLARLLAKRRARE